MHLGRVYTDPGELGRCGQNVDAAIITKAPKSTMDHGALEAQRAGLELGRGTPVCSGSLRASLEDDAGGEEDHAVAIASIPMTRPTRQRQVALRSRFRGGRRATRGQEVAAASMCQRSKAAPAMTDDLAPTFFAVLELSSTGWFHVCTRRALERIRRPSCPPFWNEGSMACPGDDVLADVLADGQLW